MPQGLSYETLAQQGYTGYLLPGAPERVLQFGEGNFLRAFADDFIDIANEACGFNAKVVVVQPIQNGLAGMLNAQDGLYTRYLRGFEGGRRVDKKRVISCLSRALNPYGQFDEVLACAHNPALRYILSNTTEAGIVYDNSCGFTDTPPASFPAKLTRFLYERFEAFGGAPDKGLVMLSCELIDNNGAVLRECVRQYITQWGLSAAFAAWVEDACLFCSTLVDRIVTGYPRDEAAALNTQNGYEDKLLVTAEVFGLWVIEGPQSLAAELPFAKAGLPVKVVPDVTPYKQQKVRILNGAHTCMVPAAFLAGKDIVRECMDDTTIRTFLSAAINEEILQALTLPREETAAFAAAVEERFQNPFIRHSLLDISLNCTSKWRARVLPSIKAYYTANGALPARLTFSFAAMLAFYDGKKEGDSYLGTRNGEAYPIRDDAFVLDFFAAHSGDTPAALVDAICASTRMWDGELDSLPGFREAVAGYLSLIREKGAYEALAQLA